MPEDRKGQVKSALEDVAALDDVCAHPNVKAMKGEWERCWRLRVGTYRAIVQLSEIDGEILLEVLIIGPRGDVY